MRTTRPICVALVASLLVCSNVSTADEIVELSLPARLDGSAVARLQAGSADEVTLVADEQGDRIVIRALDAQGVVIGRAELTRGLDEAPMYVKGSDGLRKLLLRFAAD